MACCDKQQKKTQEISTQTKLNLNAHKTKLNIAINQRLMITNLTETKARIKRLKNVTGRTSNNTPKQIGTT
jgi:hypothetical protein